MNKSKKNMRKTRRFPWGKIILGLLASVVILLVAAMLTINTIANKQINQALKRYLPEGGRLEGVYIFPMRGKVSFEGLSINPPKGYGKGPILSLNSLGVDVDMSSLLGDEIVVEELTMEGLSVGLMRDKHGHLNIVKLITPIIEGPDKDVTEPEPSKAAGANSDGGEQTSVSIPAIRVQSIRFENLFVQLDDKLAGENWSAGLRIDLDVNELRLRDLLNQDILVGRINLALSNVTIDQPEGFGHVPLMAIDKIEMETPGYGIGGPRLVVSHILVDNLAASFERNKEGVVNLLKLLETFSVKTEEGNESKQGSVETIDESASGNGLPVICLEQVKMKNSAFTYRDHMLAQETLTFPLKNIQMEVDGLCLFEEKKDADPASAIMSFELGQPGELPVAYFGSAARIGPVGSGVPLVNSQVRLTGFKLDTLGSLVPSATSASLGATGFDASMALALDGERVKLNASVLSDKNIKYRGITVHGPLNAPEVELGILDGIYGRVSDGLINFGQSGIHAGVGIAEGGVDAVKEVGSGAIGVAKNIGKNLLKAGAGLFSFDQEKVKDGLVGSTKGSADITLDSVKGAGSAAEGRLRGSVSELKGENAVKEWNKGIPARFITSMKQAEDRLAKMPYPPVTK